VGRAAQGPTCPIQGYGQAMIATVTPNICIVSKSVSPWGIRGTVELGNSSSDSVKPWLLGLPRDFLTNQKSCNLQY